MAELLSQVRGYVQQLDLVKPGAALVVGVSGGPDSLCLLHLLGRLAAEWRWRLHVAHLNHGLRGADSDGDAEFVAGFTATLGLPCTIGKADGAALRSAPGLSLEEAARQARYQFLTAVAQAVGVDTIAVGHHADDQAETVLMHFLRGSGVTGLRGMLPKTQLDAYRLGAGCWHAAQTDDRAGGDGIVAAPAHAAHSTSPWLIRPLLTTPRAAIEAYCAEYDLQPRVDRSNLDPAFLRNRLRHELLPILARYNPAIRDVLGHTATVMAGDAEILRASSDAAVARVTIASATPLTPESFAAPDVIVYDLSLWRALPIGLQRATIREAIQRLRTHLRNVNWEHVERAVWLARIGATGQAATLTAGLALQIGYGTLRIAAEGAIWPTAAPQVTTATPLAVPGATPIGGGWQIVVSRMPRGAAPADLAAAGDPWTAFLDADTAGADLAVRPRQPGERFQPQGMSGRSASLHAFMINAKIPRDARGGWPILVARDQIAWVCGLRLDERGAVSPQTQTVWQVRFISP